MADSMTLARAQNDRYDAAMRDNGDGGTSEYVWPGRPEYGPLYEFMMDDVPALLAELERLEQAVLESWLNECNGVYSCDQCVGLERADYLSFKHAEDCIVPALIAKYEGALAMEEALDA